ncbi:MAG: RadC-like JAB domain, partial [Porphyrobacter sp. HL-46]
MAIAALNHRPVICDKPETRLGAMIEYLRAVVLAPDEGWERCHAIFVDAQRCYLGDAACGMGSRGALSLRMRAIFADALRLDARGMILAHNHPS